MVDLTIKNYRCFADPHPARVALRPGFTAFVGVNNSGKSSLLKFFYELRGLLQVLVPPGHLLNAVRGQVQSFSVSAATPDITQLFSKTNGRPLEIVFSVRSPYLQGGNVVDVHLGVTVLRDSNNFTATIRVGGETLAGEQVQFSGGNLHYRGNAVIEFQEIPQTIGSMARALYIGPFRNVINIGGNEDYFDIRIGQSFVEEWKVHKSGPQRQQNEAAYRLTRDIQRLFGFETLEINPSPDSRTLQLIINGKSFGLNEVGGGVSQFVVVLANASFRRPTYVLIDEPELNLHPSLQIDFLTTLGSYASEGVIFATHNIGLGRAVAERLYAFKRVGEFETEVRPYETIPRLSEFLGELSFAGYQEMGFEKILLVEGPSDVKTIQQILRMHGKEHQIVLLPLGGGTLINAGSEPQLHEIKRISNNLAAIIDSELRDRGAVLSGDRQGFVEACTRAGVKCHVLERRAIENYLSDRAVKALKGDKYRALRPFERLGDVSPAWGKEENWRIAREMSRDELDGTDLGAFVATL